jgi:hypothetical protein
MSGKSQAIEIEWRAHNTRNQGGAVLAPAKRTRGYDLVVVGGVSSEDSYAAHQKTWRPGSCDPGRDGNSKATIPN